MPGKKIYFLLIGISAALFATLVATDLAKAASKAPDRLDGWQPCRQEQQGQISAQRAEFEQALAEQDYQSWRALVGEEKFSNITEQNFEKFVQLHELRQAGDWLGVKTLAAELGMPKLKQKISGFHRHHFSIR